MDWNDTDHIDPGGRWLNWKLRGNFLISPDGDRVTPERLRGLLFTESLRVRRDKACKPSAEILSLAEGLRTSIKRLSGGGAGLQRDPDISVAVDLVTFDHSR